MAENESPPLLPPPIDPKARETIDERIEKDKTAVIGQLKTMPVVQVACHRAGISPATFYRWKEEDKAFADAVDAARREGKSVINDLAVSKLITNIQNEKIAAIIFWLKNNDPEYAPKPSIVIPTNGSEQSKELVISWEDKHE